MSITVLFSGIDTLEASFRGSLYPCLVALLDELKAIAQRQEQPQPLEIAGYPLSVQAKGLTPFRHVLAGEDLHVRIAPRLKGPNVSVRLLSLGLLTYGHQALYEIADRIARELGVMSVLGLSRLDLAVDFQGFAPTFADSQRIVCPAVFRPIYPNVERPETFQFGRDQVVVRIYNKSREIETSGKVYWREVWANHPGYNPELDVWRFELQLRGGALSEFGCRLPQAAFASLDRLLGSGLSWCNLRVPNGQSSDRWEEDPLWQELRSATFSGEPLSRIKAASYVGGTSKLVPMAAGILVSVAARLGIRDPYLALEVFGSMISDHYEKRGLDFEREVSKRQVLIDGSRKELQSG